MPRWSDDPRHILGVLANYLRLDDPGLRPGRAVRPRRRGGRGDDRHPRRPRPAPRPLRGRARPLRAAPRPAARRAARAAEVLAGRRARPRCAAQLRRGRRGSWPPRAPRRGRTTCSSSTSPRPGAALGGADLRELRRRAAGRRTSAELRRRHMPRVLLSDGTEPEAAAPRASCRTARWSGTPGLGRHGHRPGAGDPRPGRRAPGARARSSSRRRPTPAGRRCSSPPAAW